MGTVIDFHTHIFPDKIAKKTIDLLSAKADIPPFLLDFYVLLCYN